MTAASEALLHTCSDGLPLTRLRRSPAKRQPDFTVDLHCHLLTPEVDEMVAQYPQKKDEFALQVTNAGVASAERNKHLLQTEYRTKLIDIAERIEDMDAMGIDVQAVSPSPTQYYYWAERDLAEMIVRSINERIAETCAAHPQRFVGLGTVALQDPGLAAEQAEYAVKHLGLRGIEISSQVNGVGLGDPCFDKFWSKIESLGSVVFLHPLGTSLGPRLNEHYLSNVIGQPVETTIALSQMIFGGVFDRFESLHLCAAHGGGYLPLYAGRSDHAYLVRPEACGCQHKPSDYLRRIWFDTVVYEPQHIRRLIDAVGVSQLVIGTDYPFDMGSYSPHELLAGVDQLSTLDRQMILGTNASRLLGINPEKYSRGCKEIG